MSSVPKGLVLFLDHLNYTPAYVVCGVDGLGTKLVTCSSGVQAFATGWQRESEWPTIEALTTVNQVPQKEMIRTFFPLRFLIMYLGET